MSLEINTNIDGKRFSFLGLLNDENIKIEIPVIQRDYAQGRASSKEVLELFLEALDDYLNENIPNRDLDFVYGSTYDFGGSRKIFVPLDGQQRLTTLFLLHWYLANISGNSDSFQGMMLSDNSSNFSYKTRTSSAEFCDSLVKNAMDFSSLLPSDKNSKNSLSKTIRNKKWFFSSWNQDPTVKAMLNTLDSIHERFFNKSFYYERISNTEVPIITFLYLDLEQLNLSDDLYIKMNSRGKALTTFENFKAKFEKEISTIFRNSQKKFILDFDGATQQVNTKEYFSFKIDTNWSNLFWNYRHLIGDKNTYDDELMNFIRNILSFQFALYNPKDLEGLKYILNCDVAKLSFNKLKSYGSINEESVKFLIDALDIFENGNHKIKTYLSNDFYFYEEQSFENLLKNKMTLPERVVFYAYLKYLLKYGNDGGLEDWIRVISNLAENSRIEENEHLVNALRSVENLIPNANNILEYLRNNNKISLFYSTQVFEESIKAHLVSMSKQWEQIILETEKEIFHKGQIGYLLEFCGIWEYYQQVNNCNWNESQDKVFYNLFLEYKDKSFALFNYVASNENTSYLLERALLTKGNYLVPASNHRYNFSSKPSVPNYLRDYSWKRILRIETGDGSDKWTTRRNYIKNIFDDSRFTKQNIVKTLSDIKNDGAPDWRNYFVKNDILIDYCKQGFIYKYEPKHIQLLNASQMNHKHVDLLTYELYIKLKQGKVLINPFKNIELEEVKSHYDYPFVKLSNLCISKIYYVLKTYYYFDYESKVGKYYIEFRKEKGDNYLRNYPDNIQNLLAENSLEWDSNHNYFIGDYTNEPQLLKALESFCLILNEI